MLRRPLIVGCNGSMGTRYQAVLSYIGVDFVGIDVGQEMPKHFDSVIVCTPTDTHIQVLAQLPKTDVPILMEKPFWKDVVTCEAVCDTLDKRQTPIRMVNQYWHLGLNDYDGLTAYNYFRSGKDGLAWDCISLLALANGPVNLDQTSPIWSSMLNGNAIAHADVEYGYVEMIRRFLWHPPAGPETPYIRMAHRRVAQYIEGKRDFDRDPGALRIYQTA